MTLAAAGQPLTITIPQLLNDAAAASVTVTSRDPKVAVPNGAANGVLTLNFAAGAPNAQTITVTPVGLGSTTFEIVTTPQNCGPAPVTVEVVAVPEVLLTDDFAKSAIDTKLWVQDNAPFDSSGGAATADSGITVTNGQARISVTVETATWPGLALFTANKFTAGPTTPLTFEVDRTALDFVLVTGTGAYEQAGIWVKDANGNFVFFTEKVAHDGRNFGWRYNNQTGAADDKPADDGVNIAAFDAAVFNDQKNHRMGMVVNGSTVKLYLDGVLGAVVPFTGTQGLTFGFGAYVQSAGDVVIANFDNAKLSGGSAPFTQAPKLTAALQSGNLTITWTGTGALQSADSLSSPITWTNVTPAPTSPYTVAVTAQSQPKFYRVKQ
jgi:hypothetical protein